MGLRRRTWGELVALHAEVLLIEVAVSQAFCAKVSVLSAEESRVMSRGVERVIHLGGTRTYARNPWSCTRRPPFVPCVCAAGSPGR